MKLAQCIILDLLKDYDPVPILPETCDFHFSGVQLLDQDNPTDDPSILYIGTTTQISSFDTEKLKDFCIICIGKKEDVFFLYRKLSCKFDSASLKTILLLP